MHGATHLIVDRGLRQYFVLREYMVPRTDYDNCCVKHSKQRGVIPRSHDENESHVEKVL